MTRHPLARLLVLLALATQALAQATPTAPQAAQDAAPAGEPDIAPGAASFDPAVAPELQVLRARTGHLLVKPVVNGHDAGWFIFDTGAGICCVSTPHVERLGLAAAGSLTAVGVGGGEGAALWRAQSLQLGPLTLRDHPLMATDFSFLREHLGEEIAGVIGYGVLARCVAELDLVAPRIALRDPAGYALGSGAWARMSLEGRVPSVEASYEGRTGSFRLDTGSNSVVTFHEPAVRTGRLLEGRETSAARLGGVGGFVPARRGRLASFELGGVVQRDLPADFALEPKGTFADATRTGNIGGGLLQPFVLVLDYGGERLALQPRDAPP